MKDAIGIDEKNPGVFVKSFPQLVDIVFIEGVNVKPHDANDFIVVICSRSHDGCPLGGKQAGDEIFEKGPERIYSVWSAGGHFGRFCRMAITREFPCQASPHTQS